jgi:ectoine hydroxylase-related dioxygenase (phytanoyl-CoA dioxygenase family)
MVQMMVAVENPEPAHFVPSFLPDREAEAEAEAARARVFAEIDRLNLAGHVADLDRQGYTVLLPEEVRANGLAPRLKDAILKVSGKRRAARIDAAAGASGRDAKALFGEVQFELTLLPEDPIFEQALMNEPALALATYLLGESCVLCHMSSMVKGPGRDFLPLHADINQRGVIAPFQSQAQVANVTWALTDYTKDDGALCIVPGSHQYCRAPTYTEATDVTRFHPVEVPAGSIVIWQGNTWHGAVPRRNPGTRVNLITSLSRWYHRNGEEIAPLLPREAFDRNPPRFAVLTGAKQPMLDFNSATARAGRVGIFV